MADPKTCDHGFDANPSIFGLGLRISFYCIAGLVAVTPIKSTFSKWQIREIEQGKEVRPTQEISSVVTAQGVTGLGLLITAVIQTIVGEKINNSLSLYHAYLVINLLFLMSTSFLYFLFSPNPVVRRRWFVLSLLVLLAIFTLYVGLNARTFGSQPECNNTIKIIWPPFQSKTASFAWFRRFGIAIFVIYITVAIIHGVQLILFRNRASVGSASSKAFRWHGLLVLVINVVLVCVIEATIIINDVPGSYDLPTSFGQILPLVMLIVPVADVWNDNFPLLKAMYHKFRAAHKSQAGDRDIPLPPYVAHSSHSPRRSHSGYFPVDS